LVLVKKVPTGSANLCPPLGQRKVLFGLGEGNVRRKREEGGGKRPDAKVGLDAARDKVLDEEILCCPALKTADQGENTGPPGKEKSKAGVGGN